MKLPLSITKNKYKKATISRNIAPKIGVTEGHSTITIGGGLKKMISFIQTV